MLFAMKRFSQLFRAGFISATLSTLLFALASCEDSEQSTQLPAVSLLAGNITETSISFTITATDATEAAYMLVSDNDGESAIPSPETILNGGAATDVSAPESHTESSLIPGTRYTVYAVARNQGGFSEVKSIEMTTVAVIPTVDLSLDEATAATIKFILVPSKAVRVAYLHAPEGEEAPSAETILEQGKEANATTTGSYTIEGLLPSTSYTIYAVAQGEYAVSEVAKLTASTLEPEPAKAGDFYYSDGTWSSGSSDPIAGKTCIGIVFLAERSTSKTGIDDCSYKNKDKSSSIETVQGYVVALNNACEGNGASWGSWGDDDGNGANTSIDKTDFRGYSNSQNIIARATEKGGGLSDDKDHNYPAAYYAINAYEETTPAPAQSSGWFMPSARQLEYIYEVYEDIHASMNKLPEGSYSLVYRRDAIYWSSTEYLTSYSKDEWAYMVNLDEANITPGYISNQRKTKEYWVRSILVF